VLEGRVTDTEGGGGFAGLEKDVYCGHGLVS
jgi:hypothetical protein